MEMQRLLQTNLPPHNKLALDELSLEVDRLNDIVCSLREQYIALQLELVSVKNQGNPHQIRVYENDIRLVKDEMDLMNRQLIEKLDSRSRLEAVK